MTELTVGSLFSGIGGLDLGLERAGMRVIWQSEIDPYCTRVLAKHWPNTPNLGDIKQVDWSTVERPDVIAGGYPCQPFSTAGNRSGDEDVRHLWPYMLNAIRVLRPRFAVMENVSGHLSLGFGRVLGDLAESGYDAQWTSITAAAVGAPHRRERVFIVAYPERVGPQRGEDAGGGENVGEARHEPARSRPEVGHAWLAEPDVGRVADGVPSRVDRLRGLGNAVVPQVSEFIGRQLMDALAFERQGF